MKKIKIFSILLLILSICAFGAYLYYDEVTRDTTAPIVTCKTPEISVSVAATEGELLQDVTATDDKSGDVSGTLVIESISAFAEENNRVITYAAIDAAGNVGRCTRILKYTDYKTPTFMLTEPLRFPIGSSFEILGRVRAESPLDGDLTDNIKYTLESTIDVKNTGVYPVEFRVTDSAGNIEYLSIEIEIYDQTKERIDVVLSEYLVYVPVNSTFDPALYFVGSDIDGELLISSNVDLTKEGTYSVDYTVNNGNSIGESRLVVVVTGQ